MLEQTPREQRQQLIDANHAELSLRRQCELLQVNRSTIYYKAAEIDVDDIDLLNGISGIWERYPFLWISPYHKGVEVLGAQN